MRAKNCLIYPISLACIISSSPRMQLWLFLCLNTNRPNSYAFWIVWKTIRKSFCVNSYFWGPAASWSSFISGVSISFCSSYLFFYVNRFFTFLSRGKFYSVVLLFRNVSVLEKQLNFCILKRNFSPVWVSSRPFMDFLSVYLAFVIFCGSS